MTNTRIVRVASIRSSNPLGRGGVIFYGVTVDAMTKPEGLVVVASGRQLGETAVEVGQRWRVGGASEPHARVVKGYRIVEQQVSAVQLELVVPSGEDLVGLLSECASFQGVSKGKAQSLWATFRERLQQLLDDGDIATLAQAKGVSLQTAERLVAAWKSYGEARLLQWLNGRGVAFSTGRAVQGFFGPEVQVALKEDPYRLLSFGATWNAASRVAEDLLGIEEATRRRPSAAAEEALFRLHASGHTAATPQMLHSGLTSLLRLPPAAGSPSALDSVKELASRHPGIVVNTEGCFQHLGAYVMEAAVSEALSCRMQRRPSLVLDYAGADAVISSYEMEEGLTLNAEQRDAVHVGSSYNLALITGGAGVGKTTVLKAIYRVFDALGVRVFQCALAGRATQRMQHATGKPARTIASLVYSAKDGDFSGSCVVVVDEASMVDIATMYQLCALLPDHVRLLVVGDDAQLMPVGAGLVLHALVALPQVPRVELKVAKRFGGAIAATALAIRDGSWPELPQRVEEPVCFLARPRVGFAERGGRHGPIVATIVELFLQSPSTTQILCPRRMGPEGVREMNLACQDAWNRDAPQLLRWSAEAGFFIGTGLRLGDPVVATRNLWERGLANGSLGRVVAVTPVDELRGRADEQVLGLVQWDDGVRRPVTEALLTHLELAYALTIHKAQGSQWERVVVVVTESRLLDRTLLYTAVTRAQRQVILVGDEDAAMRAVVGPPRASQRMTGLAACLSHRLSVLSEG